MERLWTKSFIQMTLTLFFLFFGFYLLIPTLPLYVTELGGNETHVGLIMGLFTLAAVVARPIVGGLLDRYGRKIFIIVGLIFFTLTLFAYHWAMSVFFLLALRLVHGVSWAMSTTSIGTAVTDIIPASRRGEGMGWYGMSMTVAMAVGPLVGVWIVQVSSFASLIHVATSLCVIAILFALTTKIPQIKHKQTGKIVFFDRSVLTITIVMFFLAFTYGGIMTFLPLFVETIQVNPGTFFLIYAISLTVTRPFAGKLADKRGESVVVIPSYFILILALVVLSFSTGLTGIVITAILYGIGFGSAQPVLQAATINLVAPEKRGIANASFFTAFDLGIGLGSIILGLVSRFIGFEFLFLVCAVSAVLSFIIYALFVKRLLGAEKVLD